MKALFSADSGLLVLPKKNEQEGERVVMLRNGAVCSALQLHHQLSLADDWTALVSDSEDTLIGKAEMLYHAKFSAKLIQIVISGSSDELRNDIFSSLESFLSLRVKEEQVLNYLLVAPLKSDVSSIAKLALSYGFAVVARVVNSLLQYQGELTRLTTLWLSEQILGTEKDTFLKTVIWNGFACNGIITRLLDAQTYDAFVTQWNLAIFSVEEAHERKAITAAGKRIVKHLALKEGVLRDIDTPIIPEIKSVRESYGAPRIRPHVAFERAGKQIEAILAEIYQANDVVAKRYINELVKSQTSDNANLEHAVKSLCNIAQRSVEMFRFDFEEECLTKALQLTPDDSWLLTQYADHLKRLEAYPDALLYIERAIAGTENDVPLCVKADILRSQGLSDEALTIYKSIADWESKPTVYTAVADMYRQMGRLNEAEVMYRNIIAWTLSGPHFDFSESSPRAYIGIAEIKKKQGMYDESVDLYDKVLTDFNHDPRADLVYRLGFSNLLKIANRIEDAYVMIQDTIDLYQFSKEARFVKASIEGIMGKENTALAGLSDLNSKSNINWIASFHKGLLLLRTRKYKDAEKELVYNVRKSLSTDNSNLQRLGAAVYYLNLQRPADAAQYLFDFSEMQDHYIKYLSGIIRYHVAVQSRLAQAEIDEIRRFLHANDSGDANLKSAIVAIERRDFKQAVKEEVRALLKTTGDAVLGVSIEKKVA